MANGNTERRFETSYKEIDRDEPGLIQEDDGTVWLVNPDGTRDQVSGGGGPSGGGVTVVRFPFAWDTPGLAADGAGGGGVEVYTPTPGDVLLGESCVIRSVAFNGTDPTLWVYQPADRVDLSSNALLTTEGFQLINTETTEGVGDTRSTPYQIGSYYLNASTGQNIVFLTADPLMAVLDDLTGDDPESTAGEGELVLLIAPAA